MAQGEIFESARVAPIDFSKGFVPHDELPSWKRTVGRTLLGILADKTGVPDQWSVGDNELQARFDVHDDYLYADLFSRTETALSLGYIEGSWTPNLKQTDVDELAQTGHPESDALVSIMRGFCRRLSGLRHLSNLSANVLAPLRDTLVKRRDGMTGRQPSATQQDHENIQHHYDIGNLLYTGKYGFLDEAYHQYSSGLLDATESPEEQSLDQLQAAKIDELVRKLQLEKGEGQEVLEIGTGWGGLAGAILRAADVDVVSLTLSEEQKRFAEARFGGLGVEDRAEVKLEHYRDFARHTKNGSFDRLVSVEMIEAVDWPNLSEFIDVCSRLTTRQGGKIVLQAILVPDERYNAYKHRQGFINTHIFPDGRLHSQRAITHGFAERGWRVEEETDLTLSYAFTLRHWRRRFNERFSGLQNAWQEQGVSTTQCEQFQRGWNMYLAASEAGFLERHILDKQFTFVPAT